MATPPTVKRKDIEPWSLPLNDLDHALTMATHEDERRQLYVALELARMDYMQQSGVATILDGISHAEDENDKKAKESTDDARIVLDRIKLFDHYRHKFDIQGVRSKSMMLYIRLSIALLYTLICVPLMFITLPLRLLHPTLRTLGLQNHSLPIDVIQKLYARGFLYCCGIELFVEGLSTVDPKVNTIGMFSHGSNLDPFVVAAGPLAFKFIGKKQLFRIPIIGWISAGWGHISIDRSNLTHAIASLKRAVNAIYKWGRCVAIAPEGTRSTTGRLLDFKKGPFHTAKEVGLPITPMIIFGAFELWPPGQVFTRSGRVTVRFCESLPVVDTDTHASLANRARRFFLQSYAIPPDSSTTRYTNGWRDVLWVPLLYIMIYALLARFV